MEKVYPPALFEATAKLTNLSNYFESFFELTKFVSDDEMSLSKDELILRRLNDFIDLEDTKCKDRSDLCSVNALSVPGEIPSCEVFDFTRFTMKIQRDYGVPEAGNKLETIQAKLKYDNIQPRKKEFDNVVLKQNIDSSDGTHDLSLNNSLVVVRIYLPFSATLKKLSRRGDKLKCSHEIVALTSNLLSELRDQILCASDNGLCVDIDDLKARPVTDVKLEYPSGLIGIDDVLYIDMRSSNAVDYSDVIKQWGLQKNIAKFKVVEMNQVQLQELNLRLGYPYIYQHRGNCEHVIVFSDVSLIKSNDPLCRSKYPFYRSINRYNIELCNICHIATAKWLVCECDRLPHDRTFLCQDCFISYNYIDGKRIGHFKAYPYYSRSSVL